MNRERIGDPVPIIFLNGASSAGKTSLGKALQEILDEPYLLFGLDTCCLHAVGDRWGSGGRDKHLGFAYMDLPPEDGHEVYGIRYGAVGWRIMAGFHRSIAEFVRSGNLVIVDEMLLDTRVRDHWFTILAPFQQLLVGVQCQLDELERRERQRGNSPGLARWSGQHVHAGVPYDMVVDTTSKTPLRCAGEILDHINVGRVRPTWV